MQEGGKKEERRRTFSPPGNKLEGAEEEEKCWGETSEKTVPPLLRPLGENNGLFLSFRAEGKNPFRKKKKKIGQWRVQQITWRSDQRYNHRVDGRGLPGPK